MKTNTFSNNDKEIKKYISLINNCKMIEHIAKEILSKNPVAWINIMIKAFDVTVKSNAISIDSFAMYIVKCTFIEFLEILEKNGIILTEDAGMLLFLGTGDLEEILLNSLLLIKLIKTK
ncbi:hypothetical protein LAV73_08930 [Lysinibacillus xylanilyticus]|uniref:hypothetical protein n=1 Tax=Lysinibacillus xylanilyticus TaxID=582475 RepID=UPI002B245DC9|nr:hypothetical protein [Lysinibacillus xylanilyticus]MEB2280118.1 hypothetical protein [Lysinibacillus xylanilyticus]